MDRLNIRLFGGLQIERGGTVVPGFATQRAALLFAYLVINHGRLHHRDVLCGVLWGDEPDSAARKGLRNALWRVRSVIEPLERDRGTFLRVEGSHVGFFAAGMSWVDAWEFETCVAFLDTGSPGRDGACWETIERMERAVALYRGDLLAGHYDAWCLAEQERFRFAYLTLLERLLGCHRDRAAWLEAIGVANEILRLDPLREHVHRAVMEFHLAMGDRPSALRQYARCTEILRTELGVEPMYETRALHERMMRGDDPERGSGRPGWHRRNHGPDGLVREVDDALRALQGLTEQLERTRLALVGEDARDGKVS